MLMQTQKSIHSVYWMDKSKKYRIYKILRNNDHKNQKCGWMWEQNLSDKKFMHCIADGNFTSNKNERILPDFENIQLKYALLLISKPDHIIYLL